MVWFKSDEAVLDLLKMSSKDWKRKYAEYLSSDGTYKIPPEPAEHKHEQWSARNNIVDLSFVGSIMGRFKVDYLIPERGVQFVQKP